MNHSRPPSPDDNPPPPYRGDPDQHDMYSDRRPYRQHKARGGFFFLPFLFIIAIIFISSRGFTMWPIFFFIFPFFFFMLFSKKFRRHGYYGHRYSYGRNSHSRYGSGQNPGLETNSNLAPSYTTNNKTSTISSTKTKSYCTNYGSPNDKGDMFCAGCGYKLL